MTEGKPEQFREYLFGKHLLSTGAALKLNNQRLEAGEISLRMLWESTDLPADNFAEEVARFWGIPRIQLPDLLAATSLVERFSKRFLRETMVFPFHSGNGFKLAMADPSHVAAIRAAEIVLNAPIEIAIASFEDIETALEERLETHETAPADLREAAPAHSEDDIDRLRDLASGAPVVRAVNELLEIAIEQRASDIHIEPFRSGLAIRMRIDGLLRTMPSPAGVLPQALISRIKILAALNIAERRLPQDGAARMRVGRADLDVRVATMPTQYGESCVVRLLPRDRGLLDVAKLGLSSADEKLLGRLLTLPHGMIILTGPTGSGKTTTLAAMLSVLNEKTRKILTIEDPVEYEISGINQTQVKPSIGLTFASAMRAFVRQDPDVIMVGEIRDPETAHIAVHAALTGHLVLTTLHTETAAAAVPRLLDLGVEAFLLKSVLRAVIGQRLVRVLCDRCKTRRIISEADLAADPRLVMLGLKAGENLHQAGSCERCGGTGYRGRTGVYECLEMTEKVRSLVGPEIDSDALDRAAIQAGMTTMIDDAIAKCRAGVTSTAEALRVTTVR